jgi:GWxTD domain-containing protein
MMNFMRIVKKIKIYLFAGSLLVGAGVVHAQHFARDARNYFDFGEQFYCAAEQSANAAFIDVRINTANALFSFLKSDKANASRGAYFAVRDVSVELREKPAGQTLRALNLRDTIFTKNFSETTSKETWNSLVHSIPLDGITLPQNVEVHVEVRDGFLSRLANRPATLDIALRSFRHERSFTGADSSFIGMSDILVLENSVDANTYRSKNWGNTTEFSRDITGAMTIALQKNLKIDSINIRLTQLSDIFQEKDFQPAEKASFTVKPESIISDKIVKAADADSEVIYRIMDAEKKDSTFRFYAALFTLPGKMLEVGKYRLDIKVRAAGSTRSFSQPLDLNWHYMPLSLDNPRDAIPPLQHITTDDEFKYLSSGSRDEQLKKLYTFWKKQDPTPETAYNEHMAEFYRRADYAYFNFARSARVLDGALTDRGKIYILYGSPTNIERTFLLGETPVEIWTYSNNVKKSIKFSDLGGHGDYKLVAVSHL